MLTRVRIELRYLIALARCLLDDLGYDMLADARRWRWVPMTCCRCGKPAWRRTHPRVKR